jgi:peptide/nickel transport system permease protein
MSAITTRLVRSSLLEVLNEDYVLMARANGLDERQVLRHHALRNAMLPVLTFAGLQMGFLIGGAMVVETVFSWPGVGKLLVDSIMLKDFSMVQGCVLVIAVLFCLITLLIDVLYAVIDPRVRYEG